MSGLSIRPPQTHSLLKLADIGQMAGNRRRYRHCGTHQMRTAATSLPPLKIAVRCGGTALSRLQPVGVHRKTHGTSGLAPLEARFEENTVQAFLLRLLLHQP